MPDGAQSRLFLLSSSRHPGSGWLDFAFDPLRAFLDGRKRAAFAPFAIRDHGMYEVRLQEALAQLDVQVESLHRAADPRAAVASADVLIVGGGNSFRLLSALWQLGLVEVVRERVAAGALRYVGWSAGSNMACPSLRTTNDMPIVQPRSFEAFSLIPFQINPHYEPPLPGGTLMNETRDDRLREFLEENDVPVLGMLEGSWLERQGAVLRLEGVTGARLFRRGEEPRDLPSGTDLSWLLDVPARFDCVS